MDEELFKLPEELPTELNALGELRSEAEAAFEAIKTKVEAGEDLSDEELEQLKYVVDAIAQIDSATAAAEESKSARNQSIADLIKAGEGESDEDDADKDDADKDDETDEAAADVVAEAEKATEEAAKEGVSASAKAPARRTKFSGIAKGKTPAVPKSKEIGWQMNPEAHGYKSGHVGFAELAAAVEGVRPGARARSNRPVTGGYAQLAIASITRDIEVVDDPHELVAAIEKATDESRLPGGSLTAAGGWCAPSETLYDFCEVPSATDLLSLPEITIRRGGVRWPVEPDLSAIFESFQFFFTEPELEAVDGTSFLTAVTLLASYRRHLAQKTAVSCKRADVLKLELADFKALEAALEQGFKRASELLAEEKIFDERSLPYATQLIPLAAICAHKSPLVKSGRRELAIMMSKTGATGVPASNRRIAGSRRPS